MERSVIQHPGYSALEIESNPSLFQPAHLALEDTAQSRLGSGSGSDWLAAEATISQT